MMCIIFDWRGETSEVSVYSRGVLNTLSSLKARLIAFWREECKIKGAVTVQAVEIFGIPRLEWHWGGGGGALFEKDSNKR